MKWILAVVATALCAPAAATAQGAPPPAAAGYPGHYPYTQADIDFMAGMISHHAQALVMARWAPSHGASAELQTLCARMINAQSDEITIMQNWLRDRHQPVPEAKPVPMKMMMNGVETEMLMPGMLSDSQLARLDGARGPEFDRLFLTFMIQHHRGALTMVDQLFATPGAGQDEQVFKLANDIQADQTTEINRMLHMLLTTSRGMIDATTGRNGSFSGVVVAVWCGAVPALLAAQAGRGRSAGRACGAARSIRPERSSPKPPRRRGTCGCCPTPAPRNRSWARPTPTWRSAASTPSRATTPGR